MENTTVGSVNDLLIIPPGEEGSYTASDAYTPLTTLTASLIPAVVNNVFKSNPLMLHLRGKRAPASMPSPNVVQLGNGDWESKSQRCSKCGNAIFTRTYHCWTCNHFCGNE